MSSTAHPDGPTAPQDDPTPPADRPRDPSGPPPPPAVIDPQAQATEEIVHRLPAPVPMTPAPQRAVTVVDLPVHRLRRPGDLMRAIAAVLGIGLVLLLAVYAPATTEGVSEDVRNALPAAVRTVLSVPVTLLGGVVVIAMPTLIALNHLVRRRPRLVAESVLAAVAAALLTGAGARLLVRYGPADLVDGLSIFRDQISFTPAVAALAAFLSVAGSFERRRLVNWTWNLLWLALVLQLLIGGMSLAGALASVLLGRAVGMTARYLTGVLGDRAYGAALVRALRRCGLDPERVQRIIDGRPVEGAEVLVVVTDEPIGYVEDDPTLDPDDTAPGSEEFTVGVPDSDTRAWVAARPRPTIRTSTAVIGEEEGENRIYSVRGQDGRVWDVGVLDGDRQVVGVLAGFWSAVRFKGLSRPPVLALRGAAERAALMSYAAVAAGIRTPRLSGIATEQDSAILVADHVPGTRTLGDVPTERLTDEVLDGIWHEVKSAHAAGLAHRNLDDAAFLLDDEDRVWLTGWAEGEISSPPLSRRLDVVAVLAMLALRVGTERAMAAAARNLTAEDLEAIAPLFQAVLLPERTRDKADKKMLGQIRELLVGLIPTTADLQPVQMRRFSARTVLAVTVGVAAIVLLLTSFNLSDMVRYVRQADPWWLLAAFGLGMMTFLGSALALVALSPVRLSLWRATLVQGAASAVAIVTPAGIGPAALNLRFLQKSKLDTPMAVATVTLVQVSQIVTTIVLLIGVALATGSSGALDSLPSGTVLIVLLAILAVVAALLAIPAIRRWAQRTITPTLRQIWPRLVWMVGQPRRVVLAVVGNLMTTVGYVAAFGCTLLAFGETLPIATLTIAYLAANAAGSAVPTPGGIGAIELALTTGLRAAGINGAVALSTAFVFRLITFWIRIPLGWLALRHLQKRNLI